MKYFLIFVCIVTISLTFFFAQPKQSQEEVNQEYLRIHIRANSNSDEDQNVKYIVRDAIIEALIPILSKIETKDEAQKVLTENFEYIQSVADAVLCKNGFEYRSNAKISKEYFPTRSYEDLTLESGYYDALILKLGDGVGDNWWCIVYPAFCFLKTKKSSNHVYISKIWEIINSVKNK